MYYTNIDIYRYAIAINYITANLVPDPSVRPEIQGGYKLILGIAGVTLHFLQPNGVL